MLELCQGSGSPCPSSCRLGLWARARAGVVARLLEASSPATAGGNASPGRGLYASVSSCWQPGLKKTRVYYRLPQSYRYILLADAGTLSTQVAWWTPASHGWQEGNKCLCFFSALHTCPWGRMEWAWTPGGQGRCLEGLEAGGQVAPVVQEELFTSLEGGVELRGEAGHIGGHILENARGGLAAVDTCRPGSHTQEEGVGGGKRALSGRVAGGGSLAACQDGSKYQSAPGHTGLCH